ncbi:hypothetical protein B0H19DRAFT_1274610 [Mycena capillaripes]|nr:hypothetical protein B0H19DRAFT_1274610 [Mycena capillaripes]
MNQKIVSFLITVITQSFGTIYSTLLVFVTQTLSTKQDLQTHQILTATHDNAAAWTGLGSAVLYIWNQKAVPASMMGVFSVFLYLGNIMILHITTPALFSLEAFNASRQVFVLTEGLPTINHPSVCHNDITFFTTGSLYYLPYIYGSEPIGLVEGTLYDVPKPNPGVDSVLVGATGFNITTSDPNSFLSVGDMYLTRQLDLHPKNFSIPSSVTLYDLENALSEVVAAMFWTLEHKAPTHRISYRGPGDGAPYTSSVTDAPNALFLLPGNVTVTEFSLEIRLDLNIVAIAGGLAASIALALLALPNSLRQTGEEDTPVDGMELLHTIWLYRNHPDLDAALKQVQHPTDKSLRSAGMVPTTLVCASQKEISRLKAETEQI